MFEVLENSALAMWVGGSLWGYPIMLGLHAVGLAVVVGVFLMLDLRILGFNRGVAFRSLASLLKVAWIGLAVNVISGFALFSSQATVFVESTPFLTKISCVFLGVIAGLFLQRTLGRQADNLDSNAARPDARLRWLAIASLLCWIGAIIAGRLIAYL